MIALSSMWRGLMIWREGEHGDDSAVEHVERLDDLERRG